VDKERVGRFGRNLGEGSDQAGPLGEEHADGRSPARAFLQPIAAPSILGLLGFAVATFMVAAHVAGWYGTPQTPTILAPFAAAFGGVAQFAAAMWSYKARDGVGTGMHGAWGSFWIGYGVLWLLIGTGAIPPLT
jgi:uncharacterized protein